VSTRDASYTFLPWLRQGLANQISGVSGVRATLDVSLELEVTNQGAAVATPPLPARPVQLYGPGDLVGIDRRAVIRSDPRDWITNFEPGYLAAVEFYDEDLPWRYTPSRPGVGNRRVTPWLTLIVAKEQSVAAGGVPIDAEFDELGQPADRPLPSIRVKGANWGNVFPDAGTLWAWAHVHVNRSLTASDTEIVDSDTAAAATRLQAALRENPDLAYSRIVCPRRLDPSTGYHAVLVPSFEAGRLAGLGLDPSKAPGPTFSAWAAYAQREASEEFPVYFRWYFRTGTVGDFEYLVRLLQPKPVDKRVGRRDMDVQWPSPVIPGITDPALGGVLKLGGALRVPMSSLSEQERTQVEREDRWSDPYPHPFQSKLADFINLADAYTAQPSAAANADVNLGLTGPGDPDPMVTPPLYSRWHSMTSRLLTQRDGSTAPNRTNWVHELNLDPRHRVPAGFGTRVIQARQEDYMAAAWEQVGDVLEANQQVRRFQFGREVSLVWHTSHLAPLLSANPERLLALTSPVHARVLRDGETVAHGIATSVVPPVLASAPLRRMTRPGSRLMRALPFTDDRITPSNLIDRVARGIVDPAPPKVTPPGVDTVADIADALVPRALPNWLVDLLRCKTWVLWLLLAGLLLLLGLFLFLAGLSALATLGVMLGAGLVLAGALLVVERQVRQADVIREEDQTPAAVDALPKSPTFSVAEPGAAADLGTGGADSPAAVRFKGALRNAFDVIQASLAAAAVPPKTRFDLTATVRGTLAGLNPRQTIARRAQLQIVIPARIRAEVGDGLVEAKHYPVIDEPMYLPLVDRSAELFLPNINLIPNNSLTLLETNQTFIEAYMVGLNHELARELLWREYPTDQRGSTFRRFWDVSSFLASVAASADPEGLRESLRDIPPLHHWLPASRLGDHDARERPGDKAEEVVLVIRGELLKRYPTAVIYAHAAEWERKPNGAIDPAKERKLVELGTTGTPSEEDDPPRSKVRTPLYQAKVAPDIYFFGFDLTVPEARGGTGADPNDAPGWFFVIKERPGEPRFGFDESPSDAVVVWNDLDWTKVPKQNGFIDPSQGLPPIPSATPPGEAEKEEQRRDDVAVLWNGNVTAAELAYVMYQAPVMVAIHAAEMLAPAS
jgi:hypothetical protein